MFTFPSQTDELSPWPIFSRLLTTHEELAELSSMLDAGITVAFMLRAGEWKSSGRAILGKCYCGPSAQGDLRPLFEQLLEDTLGYYPDFLIGLSADWWGDASEEQREVLLFHEALHAGQARDKHGAPKFNRITGLPVPAIVPHDLEEFNAVVRRYGAWERGVADFLAAAREFGA
jgi:hypothetical protein